MSNGFMNKEVKTKHPVLSDFGDKRYVITEYDDNSFSCNCPAWIFHRGQRINCKHINHLINTQLVIQKVGESEIHSKTDINVEPRQK